MSEAAHSLQPCASPAAPSAAQTSISSSVISVQRDTRKSLTPSPAAPSSDACLETQRSALSACSADTAIAIPSPTGGQSPRRPLGNSRSGRTTAAPTTATSSDSNRQPLHRRRATFDPSFALRTCACTTTQPPSTGRGSPARGRARVRQRGTTSRHPESRRFAAPWAHERTQEEMHQEHRCALATKVVPQRSMLPRRRPRLQRIRRLSEARWLRAGTGRLLDRYADPDLAQDRTPVRSRVMRRTVIAPLD